jgi:hypothetical protein|tara:strand:- start:3530 stop:4081 length:552 start_codon:yes stop_codon:yes gene_type:complete
MSLATLKKKSGTKYSKTMAEPKNGFSLQGKRRNFGSPGTTNLARSVTRTPYRGTLPVGHGGCCGGYDKQIAKSGDCCVSQTLVKPSTLSTKGMLAKRLLCCTDTVKSLYHTDQSIQITATQNKQLCVNTSDKNAKNHNTCYEDAKKPSYKCKGSYTKNLPYDISTSQYVQTTFTGKKLCEYTK